MKLFQKVAQITVLRIIFDKNPYFINHFFAAEYRFVVVMMIAGVKADRIQQVEEGKDELVKEEDDAFDGNKSTPSISPQRRSKISR